MFRLESYIFFDGNAMEAAEFYGKVFKTKLYSVMKYSDSDPDIEVNPADKDKLLYAGIPFKNQVLMVMDVPTGMELLASNNQSPNCTGYNQEEVDYLIRALSEGGSVGTPFDKTMYGKWFATVTDKFGIMWTITLKPDNISGKYQEVLVDNTTFV